MRALHPLALRASVGVSLIELMITLALMGIILSIGGPALSHFLQAQRVASAQTILNSAIQTARSEAVRLNSNVSISSNDQGRSFCVHISASCTGNNDQHFQLASNISVQGWQNMIFNGQGHRISPAAGSVDIVLQGPNCEGNDARQITILPLGFAQIRQRECG